MRPLPAALIGLFMARVYMVHDLTKGCAVEKSFDLAYSARLQMRLTFWSLEGFELTSARGDTNSNGLALSALLVSYHSVSTFLPFSVVVV